MCPVSLSLSLLFFLYIYVCIFIYHAFLSLLFYILQAEPKPISIYHPTVEEVSAAMGTPIKGFFDRVDVVAETPAAAQGVLVETPILSTKPGPIEEGS